MKRVLNRVLPAALVAAFLGAVPVEAVVVPRETPLSEKVVRHMGLNVPESNQPLKDLPALAVGLQQELSELGLPPESGFYDTRISRWSSLVLSEPLVPGTGVGNRLRWVDLGGASPPDEKAIREQAWSALRSYLQAHESQLRVDLAELPAVARVTVHENGNIIFVHAARTVGGVPVRDSYLSAAINHGNLVLLGLRNWADVDRVPAASLSPEQARALVAGHVAPHAVERFGRGQQLELVPMLRDGQYDFRLAWVVPVKVLGDVGAWEALIDASNGEILLFEDKNQYAARKLIGGVYPISNDQRPPDGLEQPGWPMPFADLLVGGNTIFSTTGGTFGCAVGNAQTALSGRYLRIADSCGAISESGTGDIDLGFGPTPAATDCTVPVGHSVGDTKSARSGFYELNRIIEQARAYQPTLPWLQTQLTSNMNLPQTCNAFWDGTTVNFFRSAIASGCRNTGEIAAIFDHEWGHGLDNNNTDPSISQPGESIADIRAILRLNTSCAGRGFFINQVCGGYGDACNGTPATGCTGVRDLDFANHRCNRPHTVTWATSGFTTGQCPGGAPACPGGGGTPCGRETHCEGMVAAETYWDLYARDLQAPPLSLDQNTALELATRLSYIGTSNIGAWYSCVVGGGCGATNGYMLALATDDDNGNLNDGTPHMTAIRAAFERHEIHCATPAPVNSGCAGGPTTAPTVTATPVDGGVNLSWTAVTGASRYYVYRTEGVAACAFGKIKVGDTAATTFTDQGLLNGRPYSYMVLPVGSNLSCFGRASACSTATPVPGPNLAIRDTVTVNVTAGDGDEFLDNCETAAINFTVDNTGTGTLTNVRLVSVTPLTHPATIINTPLPAPIAPTLIDCANAAGSVSISPRGMTFNQSTQLLLEVTADQISPATRSKVVTITNVESDWTNHPTQTFGFDTNGNLDGWTIQTGTWTQQGPGAQGTPLFLNSSQNLANQCDVIRSPLMRLQATSTLSLFNAFHIEPTDPNLGPYDRANVGVVDTATAVRTVVAPSSGLLYTLANGSPMGTCGTTGQAGWNDSSPNFPIFQQSGWNAGALNPGGVFTGKRTQLEIRYGTDDLIHFEGYRFDQVTLTNFDTLGPDQQPDSCVAQAVAPFGLTVDAAGNGVFQPNETPVVVAPRWRNIGNQPITLTGAATNFTGPAGPTYTITDGSASYGTIPVNANQGCTDCYSLGITASSRPTQHWDATVLETVTPTSTTKNWLLHIGDSFTDVPASSGFYRFIETIFHKLITGGCGGTSYCPGSSTTREQMAVFVLVSKEGAGYNPPACTTPVFPDVPASSPFCKWIEELARRGVVAGCGGGNYCPTGAVTREQMAVFVLKTLDPALDPPACTTPVFADVPASSPFCKWIEELARRGVVTGCGGGNYCPTQPVTREQMAVFLAATFSLVLYGL